VSTATTRLRPSPDVVSRSIDSAAVLIHLGTNRIFELNETGSRIWSLLEQGLDRNAVCAQIQQEFDVPVSDAEQAVDDLLSELTREQLIRA
jgi:hypothetical protein